MRPIRLLLVPFLIVLLTAPAAAQTVPPTLSIRAEVTSLLIGPNETGEAKWTITNTGTAPGRVRLALPALPGWSASLASRDQTFQLNGGQSQPVSVTVRPTVATPLNATLELSGTIEAEQNVVGPTQRSSIAINFNAPPPPPPPPPTPKDYTWHIAAGIGSIVFLAGYAAQAKTATIRPYQNNMRIQVGTDGWVLIGVRNRSFLPSRVRLRVRGLEGRYVAAFSSPEVRLGPREGLQIPLLVKVPVNAKPGEHVSFQIQARPNGFSPWMTSRNVSFDTLDVKIAGPSPIPPNA